MRKIIINGFPHTGTTILRRIIGDHPNVYDWEQEIYDVEPGEIFKGMTHVVCKFVGLPIQIYPYDVTRIWLIKNPWDVFGSIYRRLGTSWKTAPGYQIKDYLHFIERWLIERVAFFDMTIKYEDYFKEPKYLEWIWDRCDLSYTKGIAHRAAGMGSRAPIPDQEPPRHMSMDFRTWQINQPIEDKTYQSAPHCPFEILRVLGDFPIIQDAGYHMRNVDGLWFPVGAKLTSLENGQLIVADPKTPQEEIVGEVTSKGFET